MKNARTSIEDTAASLNEAKHHLMDAASTVENGSAKKKIEEQINELEICLKQFKALEKGPEIQ